MNSLLGALNDYPFDVSGFHPPAPMAPARGEKGRQQEPGPKTELAADAEDQAASMSAEVLPFPYAALLRSLVEEGRILEARKLLDAAGGFIPQGSRIREALAPPRIRKSSEKGFDRSAEFHWLKTKAAPYRGRWVALLGEDLVAHADSLRGLLAQLEEIRPGRKPLIHRLD